ncbi:MAG: FAD binding domain-containing protein [Rhizomicrobium sp.]
MIPYPFTYHRAKSLADAQAMLAREPDAKLLAGGHTLIPAMKLRLANPAALIDISGLAELSYVRDGGEQIAVGAATTHFDVMTSDFVRARIPALADLVEEIGDPAVRHMGTIGGSVANNDPAADYPAAVLGLGGTVQTTQGAIAADDFFTGMFSTALEEGEIITEIRFPIPRCAAYAKFANPASRYAMVAVFVADFGKDIRVAVTGAAPCVFRALEMEAALAKDFRPEALAAISISPDGLNSDIHGSAEYRAHLVPVMARRAVAAAIARRQ